MEDCVDSVSYTDLPFNTEDLVLMPTIDRNIQSLLCYSKTFEFSITNYDIVSRKFMKSAFASNKNTVTEFFDVHRGKTGNLISIVFELKKDIDKTSHSSVFVMTFERCTVSLTIDSSYTEGVITEFSVKLKDIFFLDESDEIIDFSLSNQKIWLVSKPDEYYLILQDSPAKKLNNSSNIDIVRNSKVLNKALQLSCILFVERNDNNGVFIAFGSQLGQIQVFTYNEDKELSFFKNYDLSEHSIKFKVSESNISSEYVPIVDMKDTDDNERGIGILSKTAFDGSIFYTGVNQVIKDISVGLSLQKNESINPSLSLITAQQKLHLFVLNKEVDIKELKSIQVKKTRWSSDKMVLFLVTPGNSVFSLSLKEFINTHEVVDSSHERDTFFESDIITFKKKNLLFTDIPASGGKGTFEDPISLDDIESPVKVDRFIKQTTKRNTPLSGQKSMTDFFGKKLSPSPNKPQSAKKQLSFEVDDAKTSKESINQKSSNEKSLEKTGNVHTNFENNISVDAGSTKAALTNLISEDNKSRKTAEKSTTNSRISIANLISTDKLSDENNSPSKALPKNDIDTIVGSQKQFTEEPKTIPASDSATMKFHVPTQLVPKHLKRITPPTDDSGFEQVVKKSKKEMEPLNLLDDYNLNPILAFSKIRISIPKLRSAFQVTIQNEYSINVINKGSNDQNPAKLFLKNVGDKEDVNHPCETQFLQKSISLVTGTPSFFAFSTENGMLYICSSQTGRRLEQPLMLGVPISMLESAGNFLVCVTCVGELYCWNVEKMELAHPVASLYPILSPALRAGNDVLSRAENITSVSVTKNGVSLITLSNGDSYLFDKMMQSWSLINDSWWAYSSKHWDASNTKAGLISNGNKKEQESIMKMLEFKTNEELNRKGQAKFIQNFTKTMLFKEGFENLEQSASISHLFNKMYVYKKFEEFEEYQNTLIVLCSTLAEFGLITILQEVFDALFDIETEESIGPYKKHDLLRMSIASVYQVGTAESKRTARMYSDNLE